MHTRSVVYFLPFKGITRSAWEASEECLLFPIFTLALLTWSEIYTVGPFMTPLLNKGLVYVGGESTYLLCTYYFRKFSMDFSAWLLYVFFESVPCWELDAWSSCYIQFLETSYPTYKLPSNRWAVFACSSSRVGCCCSKLVVWFRCYLPGFILASLAE